MASGGKSQLLSFMDELIPTIRTALCDRYVSSLCDLLNDQIKYIVVSSIPYDSRSLWATPRAIGPSNYLSAYGTGGLHVPMGLVKAKLRIPMLSQYIYIYIYIYMYSCVKICNYFMLFDSMPEVRESAGLAFSTLYKVIYLFSVFI
jgi:hypothetical protein